MARLDPADVELIARRVVELLRSEADAPAAELLSAADVARRFGVARDWVYANADRLGALRLGDGERPRLRFDPERVRQALEGATRGGASSESQHAGSPVPAGRAGARRRRASSASADLLPIRGDG